MKSAFAGLVLERFDAIERDVHRRGIVAADVVERRVAERALLPVTAVRKREFVPAHAADPPERLERRADDEILVERKAAIGRCAAVGEGHVRFSGAVNKVHLAAVAHVSSLERSGVGQSFLHGL